MSEIRNWREVAWTSIATDAGKYPDPVRGGHEATLNGLRLEVLYEKGSGGTLAVYNPSGASVWETHMDVYAEDAARFLTIVHADPSYLDWREAAKILAEYLTEEIDPDYSDAYIPETNGWEDLLSEEADEFDEDVVVLRNGTRIVKNDEGEWKVRRR